MTPREYIKAWNLYYYDTIAADDIRCIRGFSNGRRCDKKIDELVVVGPNFWGHLECPDHGSYFISMPRKRDRSHEIGMAKCKILEDK